METKVIHIELLLHSWIKYLVVDIQNLTLNVVTPCNYKYLKILYLMKKMDTALTDLCELINQC